MDIEGKIEGTKVEVGIMPEEKAEDWHFAHIVGQVVDDEHISNIFISFDDFDMLTEKGKRFLKYYEESMDVKLC